MPRFEPVEPEGELPGARARHPRVLARGTTCSARSLELRKDAPLWVFYEGPPTANGKPGIHHVEARAFKDVYPRFKTMTGHHVPRKGGWDCHGLPVELEVEKEIGTTGKRDIEAFGIAEFNRLCRESVGALRRRVRTANGTHRLLDRYVGRVLDDEHRVHRERLVVVEATASTGSLGGVGQGDRLLPPMRDGAFRRGGRDGLSDGRRPERVRSVRAARRSRAARASRGVAARLDDDALDPPVEQRRRRAGVRDLRRGRARGRAADICIRRCVEPVLGVGRGSRSIVGSELVGATYRPLYPNVEGAHAVVAGDFVSTDDGTGARAHRARVRAGGPGDRAGAGVAGVQAGGRRGACSTTWHPRSSAGCS